MTLNLVTYEEYDGLTPENETGRLQALYDTGMLDSEQEALFDHITLLTKEKLGTATALISLVEKDRQWFKAKTGLSVCETSRDASFCTHTILTREPLVVLDAREDAMFRDNQLVTGPPFIRFYAGAPIIIYDQFAIGTLCVIDGKPRSEFPDEQRTFLKQMTEILSMMVEHRACNAGFETEKKAGNE